MLPDPLVKICSLREPRQAEFAVAAGADAVGLIFAEARRRVSVDLAVEIVDEVRRLQDGRALVIVGVFVDQSADAINRISEVVGLDFVQLHGTEPPDVVARVERSVIKVIRTRAGDIRAPLALFQALPDAPVAYLVDGQSSGQPGGTGARADWGCAADLASGATVILAGGLNPENVAEAIRAVRPFGVDVSSGVETDGVKDREKVIAFVAAARAAFATLHLDQGGVVPVAEAAEPAHRA